VFGANLSPDGKRVLSNQDDLTWNLWDVLSGKRLFSKKGHKDYLSAAVWSPDGRHILTGSLDKTARIWEAITGVQERVYSRHTDFVYAAQYAPDGQRVVTGSADRTLRVWNPVTGEDLAVMTGHQGRINHLAISPDGRTVASASADESIRLWDAATGLQLAILQGHERSVDHVAYSLDGKHLVTTSLDNTSRIWNAVPPASFKDQVLWAQAAEIDPLTEVQRRQVGMHLDSSRDQRWPHMSECDRAAAAYYDPARRAPGVVMDDINADVAKAACVTPGAAMAADARLQYQIGRALVANDSYQAARGAFERAVQKGYPAAKLDLADLLVSHGTGAADTQRALVLYQQAWSEGVRLAAFRLGRLYERSQDVAGKDVSSLVAQDRKRGWTWYQKGADALEPTALARFAEQSEVTGQAAAQPSERNGYLLQAFRFYATATACAEAEHWPDSAWRRWRYRRATLARVLARSGLMQQVAGSYRQIKVSPAARPAGLWQEMREKLNL